MAYITLIIFSFDLVPSIHQLALIQILLNGEL